MPRGMLRQFFTWGDCTMLIRFCITACAAIGLLLSPALAFAAELSAPVVIYGGTSAGVMAAIQAHIKAKTSSLSSPANTSAA